MLLVYYCSYDMIELMESGLLYVPLLDADERVEIMKIHLKNKPPLMLMWTFMFWPERSSATTYRVQTLPLW